MIGLPVTKSSLHQPVIFTISTISNSEQLHPYHRMDMKLRLQNRWNILTLQNALSVRIEPIHFVSELKLVYWHWSSKCAPEMDGYWQEFGHGIFRSLRTRTRTWIQTRTRTQRLRQTQISDFELGHCALSIRQLLCVSLLDQVPQIRSDWKPTQQGVNTF